jgi:hypothetical protein
LEQWKYIKWAGREWALREDLRKEHHEDWGDAKRYPPRPKIRVLIWHSYLIWVNDLCEVICFLTLDASGRLADIPV